MLMSMKMLRHCRAVLLFLAWGGAALAAAPSVIVGGGAMMNGDQFAESTLSAMREHYAGCRKVVLVLHASHPGDRDRHEERLRRAFAHLCGAEAVSLHRFDEAGQRALLERADAVFVGGGETFVLLAELHRTGQLRLLRERVAAGMVYGGASAGANVAGLLIGTTNDFPVADVPSREALGIFPAVINPHHPAEKEPDYAARAGKIAIYQRFNPEETVVGIGNAALVRWHEGRMRLVAGEAWLYRGGKGRALQVGESVPEFEKPPKAP